MYVTYGPVPALREALAQVPRLEAAAIYGSWAKRRSGEPGQVPHDLDVLAIGTPSRHALYEAIDDVEQRLGLEINVKKLPCESTQLRDELLHLFHRLSRFRPFRHRYLLNRQKAG